VVRKDNPDMILSHAAGERDAVVEKSRDDTRVASRCWWCTVVGGKLGTDRPPFAARGRPHNVLNAKYHEREAEIVAQAGRKGAITTRPRHGRPRHGHSVGRQSYFMAREFLKEDEIDPDEPPTNSGRKLSSEPKRIVEAEHKEVVGRGGLHILGTERHESRRIDNQLRGRAGRQGDPGSSRFFLSSRRRSDAHLCRGQG